MKGKGMNDTQFYYSEESTEVLHSFNLIFLRPNMEELQNSDAIKEYKVY